MEKDLLFGLMLFYGSMAAAIGREVEPTGVFG